MLQTPVFDVHCLSHCQTRLLSSARHGPSNKRRATHQDVIDSPEHMFAEIVGGELRLFNRPVGPAMTAGSVLGHELGSPFMRGRGGPGGWLILDEPELHLGDDIVVPDLAGWRRERLPVVPDAAFITVPPDWVCEVLSKSTEKFDRTEKLPLHAACGVQHAWVTARSRTPRSARTSRGPWLRPPGARDAGRRSRGSRDRQSPC